MKTPKHKEPAVEDFLERVGKRIKSVRVEKGYTNYEYFAYDNNISRTQYGRYEKGEDMRLSSLLKIVNGLGMTMEEFFKGFDK